MIIVTKGMVWARRVHKNGQWHKNSWILANPLDVGFRQDIIVLNDKEMIALQSDGTLMHYKNVDLSMAEEAWA